MTQAQSPTRSNLKVDIETLTFNRREASEWVSQHLDELDKVKDPILDLLSDPEWNQVTLTLLRCPTTRQILGVNYATTYGTAIPPESLR